MNRLEATEHKETHAQNIYFNHIAVDSQINPHEKDEVSDVANVESFVDSIVHTENIQKRGH